MSELISVYILTHNRKKLLEQALLSVQNQSYENVEIIIVDNTNFSVLDEDYFDLYTMSKCHHHILANSTFSWWGPWLSNTKGKIIAPRRWFSPDSTLESHDIIPERWERI